MSNFPLPINTAISASGATLTVGFNGQGLSPYSITLTANCAITVNTAGAIAGSQIMLTLTGAYTYSFTNSFNTPQAFVITPQCTASLRDKILITYEPDGTLTIQVAGQAIGSNSTLTAPTVGTLAVTAGDTIATITMTGAISNGSVITGYTIGRATVTGGPYTTIATNAAIPYTDSGLTDGTTYFYVAAAVNSIGTSANSAEVSATPAGFVFSSISPDYTWDTTNATAAPVDTTGNGTLQNLYDIYNNAKYLGQTSTTANVRPLVVTNGGPNANTRVLSFTSATSFLSSALGSGSNLGGLGVISNVTTGAFYFALLAKVAVTGVVERMFEVTTTDGNSYGFSVRNATTDRGFTVIATAGSPATTTVSQTTQDTNWHIVEGYITGGVGYVTIDGVSVATTTLTGTAGFTSTIMLMGAHWGASLAAAFNGQIGPGVYCATHCPTSTQRTQVRAKLASMMSGITTQ